VAKRLAWQVLCHSVMSEAARQLRRVRRMQRAVGSPVLSRLMHMLCTLYHGRSPASQDTVEDDDKETTQPDETNTDETNTDENAMSEEEGRSWWRRARRRLKPKL